MLKLLLNHSSGDAFRGDVVWLHLSPIETCCASVEAIQRPRCPGQREAGGLLTDRWHEKYKRPRKRIYLDATGDIISSCSPKSRSRQCATYQRPMSPLSLLYYNTLVSRRVVEKCDTLHILRFRWCLKMQSRGVAAVAGSGLLRQVGTKFQAKKSPSQSKGQEGDLDASTRHRG